MLKLRHAFSIFWKNALATGVRMFVEQTTEEPNNGTEEVNHFFHIGKVKTLE